MKVAALYDIHGNLSALEAVLKEIRGLNVDRIVVGGDVLPGPMPRETLTYLLELDIPTQFIVGNGDRVVFAHLAGIEPLEVPEPFREWIRWNASQLGPDHQQVFATWPKTLQIEIDGLGEVLFCHATPRNDSEIFTRLTPEAPLLEVFAGVSAPLVVCGHTHMQFDRTVGPTRVVNAGSVGMPFADPGAYWLLLAGDVQLRRTSYDLERAIERIKAAGCSDKDGFTPRDILQPRSEREMLEIFTNAGLK